MLVIMREQWRPQSTPLTPLKGVTLPALLTPAMEMMPSPLPYPIMATPATRSPLARLTGGGENGARVTNTVPEGRFVLVPAARPVSSQDSLVRNTQVFVTENTDQSLPFGPGAGRGAGIPLYGRSTFLGG